MLGENNFLEYVKVNGQTEDIRRTGDFINGVIFTVEYFQELGLLYALVLIHKVVLLIHGPITRSLNNKKR